MAQEGLLGVSNPSALLISAESAGLSVLQLLVVCYITIHPKMADPPLGYMKPIVGLK